MISIFDCNCQQKNKTEVEKLRFFGRGGQKRYFGEFSYGLELTYQITAGAVYIINAEHCISPTRSVVYHHCEERTKKIFRGVFVWTRTRAPHHAVRRAYHQRQSRCISSARRAEYHQAAGKYTLTRDEIQGRFTALDDIHHASRGDDMPSLRLG